MVLIGKRLFDILASTVGLLVLSPLLAVISCCIKLTSRGPIFFQQTRVGRNFDTFAILKFRTMVVDAPARGPQITYGDDPRITKVGKLLRKTKLDELPQLINVLKGEMSVVGPRPEVPRYVELFREDYAHLLTVPPGITSLASVQYRSEAEILARAEDPEQEYVKVVLPEKIRIDSQYIDRLSVWLDVRIILRTLLSLLTG